MRYFPLAPFASSASQIMVNEYKYAGHTLFKSSTDIFTIQRETSFGSQTYEDVDVRVTRVVDTKTGEKKSDDWKQLIFDPSGSFTPVIGSLYYFDDNFWVTTFTDNIKSVLLNCVVRRCNDQLRWIDDDGAQYTEPCCVDYEIIGVRDLVRQADVIIPQGYIPVYAQLNERTELIKANQRFLFGRPNNRICWKIFGNAIMNTQNQETLSDITSRLVTFTMGGFQVDPQLDNLELGIANYYKDNYTISLSPSSITGNIGEEYRLDAVLLRNDVPISGSISYASSASTLVSVNSSGSVTLVSAGSSIVTAYMTSSSSISASALVTVSSTPVTMTEIRITPSDTVEILEEDSSAFTAYLYINGVQQADAFTFAIADSNVPADNYTLTSSANAFTVTNINKYLDYPLLINATSGIYMKQITINLQGAF